MFLRQFDKAYLSPFSKFFLTNNDKHGNCRTPCHSKKEAYLCALSCIMYCGESNISGSLLLSGKIIIENSDIHTVS